MQRNICTTLSLGLDQIQALEKMAQSLGKSKSEIARIAIDKLLTEVKE